ncbi:MAG: Uma2 family endonuclease [Gloeomargarita sp. SKYG116]|nr:Uma2 family endonuclease [Gloeomargarita sp. SKYG116]MDW8401298.1 Uma2 family endonuclease [Gloeomargarita sp. SKYGB_i_bin116]
MTVFHWVEAVPPLENGDHLSRSEFERRYAAMPEVKAELIEGVVYMASPLRALGHSRPHSLITAWLMAYDLVTPGAMVLIDATVILDDANEVQPDALMRWENSGSSWFNEQDYIVGAPELVVEIAASSAAIDLYEKKQAYARNRVQEYIVWQTLDKRLDWFVLAAGNYQQQEPDAQGILQSQIFPGLWLDVPALLEGNLSQVLDVLQTGLRQC